MSFDTLARKMTLRPIVLWPGALTPRHARKRSPFSAPWSRTMDELDRELYQLNARNILLQLAMREQDFRLDGLPRANAQAEHPGVILSFEAPDVTGRLEFATDVFWTWQENLRAIALGLEALRKVDRYGITRGKSQYAGFRELPSGAHDNSEGLHTREQAVEWLTETFQQDGTTNVQERLRHAIRKTHPDSGGDDPELFRKVMRAKELIEG